VESPFQIDLIEFHVPFVCNLCGQFRPCLWNRILQVYPRGVLRNTRQSLIYIEGIGVVSMQLWGFDRGMKNQMQERVIAKKNDTYGGDYNAQICKVCNTPRVSCVIH